MQNGWTESTLCRQHRCRRFRIAGHFCFNNGRQTAPVVSFCTQISDVRFAHDGAQWRPSCSFGVQLERSFGAATLRA